MIKFTKDGLFVKQPPRWQIQLGMGLNILGIISFVCIYGFIIISSLFKGIYFLPIILLFFGTLIIYLILFPQFYAYKYTNENAYSKKNLK